MRHERGSLVKNLPFRTIKSMIRPGINEDLHVPALYRLRDRGARILGHEFVGLSKVQRRRASYGRELVQRRFYTNTVITDRGVDTSLRRCEPCEFAAQTKSDRPDFAGAFRPAT